MAKKDFRDEYIEGLDRSQKRSTVFRRDGGCAVIVDHRMFVWGGQSEIEDEDDEDLTEVADVPLESEPAFEVFDLKKRTWSRQLTTKAEGTPRIPINGLGSAMVYCRKREMIYLFGGWKMEVDRQFFGDIYSISISSFEWRLIKPNTEIKPSPRYNAEMILHGDRLCIFAGVGVRPAGEKHDKGAKDWVVAPSSADRSYGWNNDYFEFDLNDGCWTTPMTTEDRPPVIAGHRMVKIDSHRVLMFGGSGVGGLSGNLWLLDLDDRTWKKVEPGASWPLPARFFSLTALVDPDSVGCPHRGLGPILSQKLVLMGGKARVKPNTPEVCNPETWLLKIEKDSMEVTFTKLEVDLTPRSWHVAVAYHPDDSATECEVVVSTGNKHIWPGKAPRNVVSDTCIMTFGVRSLQRMCVAVISTFPKLPSSLPPTLRAEAAALIASWKRDIPTATICACR